MNYLANEHRYDGRMRYRRCGNSGLKLPEVSLGFWHNFGDIDDLTEGRKMMHCAFDAGITHFDFANNYGPPPGTAEENCGRILKQDFAAYRDELIISTKAGHLMWPGPYGEWGSRKSLLASLDQSLSRLKLDYVDIFYSHRPDPETPLEETMGALATAVQQGKALYIGLSKYPLPMLQQAVAILNELRLPCTIYQPPLNLLDTEVLDDGRLDWLAEQGIGSIVFSPLAQGMLTHKYLNAQLPETSRAARKEGFLRPQQVEANLPKIKEYAERASAENLTLQHYALRWTLQQPSVTSALIGARNRQQLKDNIAALQA